MELDVQRRVWRPHGRPRALVYGDERARLLVSRKVAAALVQRGCVQGLLVQLHQQVSRAGRDRLLSCQSPALAVLDQASRLAPADRSLLVDLAAHALAADLATFAALCAAPPDEYQAVQLLGAQLQLTAAQLHRDNLDASQREAVRALVARWQGPLAALVASASKL